MTSLKLLYEETSAGVYSFTLSMLNNREDAEDALQDVYLSIHKSAHLYVPMGRPMEWIMTVTRNICISKIRDRNKIKQLDDQSKPIEFPDVSHSEDRILLNEALKILTDEERKVMLQEATKWMYRRAKVVVKTPEILARAEEGDEAAMMDIANSYLLLSGLIILWR